jgi:hypothetical protein
MAQTAAKLSHSGGPTPHAALQGGGYDDDGEAHLRARALGAEGAPAPLGRAATLVRSPSQAPMLTWTQGSLLAGAAAASQPIAAGRYGTRRPP